MTLLKPTKKCYLHVCFYENDNLKAGSDYVQKQTFVLSNISYTNSDEHEYLNDIPLNLIMPEFYNIPVRVGALT